MARTNWGAVIIGGGVLVGLGYVVFNWKDVCPKIMSPAKCSEPPLEWFSSPVGSAVGGSNNSVSSAGTRGINTIGSGGADTVARNVVTRGQASRNSGAAIVSTKVSGGWKAPRTGSAIVGGSARYTEPFHSFNTFTLNRLSVS